MVDRVLTSKMTAEMLGKAEGTLRIDRVHGKGPPFRKLGDKKQSPVIYMESDVLKWLESHNKFNSTSEYRPQAPTADEQVDPNAQPRLLRSQG